jgi:hypothetical protein
MSTELLTYLTQADIRDAAPEIEGKTLSRPALLYTDGSGSTYAVDVDIGLEDPLRNVPIAAGNNQLVYAETGAAVVLRRTASGQYKVTGFAKEMPGTFIRVPVTIETLTLGPAENLSLSSRPLTLEELGLYAGGFGLCPFGAIAVFRGSTLIRITA